MKVFLATRTPGDRPVHAVPTQEFFSVEWNGSEEDMKAVLDFAAKVDEFARWCREAKQAKQTSGTNKPIPEFLKPPKTEKKPRASTKRSTKQDTESSQE